MAIKLFEDLAKECNERGWLVLNCYQFSNVHWRVNLQRKTENGATENVFTEFADGKTPSEALRAVMGRMDQRVPERPGKAHKGKSVDTLTPTQQANLLSALRGLSKAFAEEFGVPHGTGSED